MDKLRMKDSQYYRNLLLKNEYKLSNIARNLQELRRSQNSIRYLATNQKEVYIKMVLLLQILIFGQNLLMMYQNNVNSVKEFVSFITKYDYSSTMFYMWEDYRKQVPTVLRVFKIWENFM
jgi:hypothetical protein